MDVAEHGVRGDGAGTDEHSLASRQPDLGARLSGHNPVWPSCRIMPQRQAALEMRAVFALRELQVRWQLLNGQVDLQETTRRRNGGTRYLFKRGRTKTPMSRRNCNKISTRAEKKVCGRLTSSDAFWGRIYGVRIGGKGFGSEAQGAAKGGAKDDGGSGSTNDVLRHWAAAPMAVAKNTNAVKELAIACLRQVEPGGAP